VFTRYGGIRPAGFDPQHLLPADPGVPFENNVFDGNTLTNPTSYSLLGTNAAANRSRRLRRPRLPTPQQTKAFAVPAKHRLGLHEQESFPPSWKHGREQRDQSALVAPQDGPLYLSRRHNKLLAQKDILGCQFGSRAQQVSRETTDDRARSRTQCFAHNLRHDREDRLQLGNGTSEHEHETDLPRDQP
jgi:hypothetical protein